MSNFVSGNGHLIDDGEARAATALVFMCELFCQAHEEYNHNGEECPSVRVSLAAYVAHNVGVRTDDTDKMLELMKGYEED